MVEDLQRKNDENDVTYDLIVKRLITYWRTIAVKNRGHNRRANNRTAKRAHSTVRHNGINQATWKLLLNDQRLEFILNIQMTYVFQKNPNLC